MNEIRVINGLHRGISLPLDGDELIIGSSLEADISLVDPGVSEQHVHIKENKKLPPNCWEIDILNGNTKNQKGKKISGTQTIKLNQRINIGGIWILIADEKEPWPFDDTSKPLKSPTKNDQSKINPFWMKVYCLLAGAMIGIVTLTHAGGDKAKDTNTISKIEALKILNETSASLKEVKKTESKITNEELLNKYKKMLKEREIIGLNIETNEDQWTITGDLKPYFYEKLSRMNFRFNKKYDNPVKIMNNTQKIEQSLPFDISTVVSGPMGHVKVSDGYKLYVGNEYKGFKLVGITKDKIMFSGKNTIEVNW